MNTQLTQLKFREIDNTRTYVVMLVFNGESNVDVAVINNSDIFDSVYMELFTGVASGPVTRSITFGGKKLVLLDIIESYDYDELIENVTNMCDLYEDVDYCLQEDDDRNNILSCIVNTIEEHIPDDIKTGIFDYQRHGTLSPYSTLLIGAMPA